jgi:hypothetical protein
LTPRGIECGACATEYASVYCSAQTVMSVS